VLSVIYPVSLFIYAALAAPRPTKTYWRLVLAYSSVVVCLKFLFQLSFLCVCYSEDGEQYALQPSCELDTCRYEKVRARHDTTRHDTTRHDTTRHDTTRHDTTRHTKWSAWPQAEWRDLSLLARRTTRNWG
jgi:hypothetical protein